MGPEDIVKVLESRGWKATIKNRSDVEALVATPKPTAAIKCTFLGKRPEACNQPQVLNFDWMGRDKQYVKNGT